MATFSITLIKTDKLGRHKPIKVIGHPRNDEQISLKDAKKVIEFEQWCEHVLGIRVHINQEVSNV